MAELGSRRDALAAQMIDLLDGAAFGGRKVDPLKARWLEEQGLALIFEARAVARPGADTDSRR